MLDIRNVVSVGGTNLNTANDFTVDTELSTTSNNPVTNKAITTAILAKQDALTVAQQSAVDSGINATKVSSYESHLENTDVHVTTSDKSAWDGKQDAISDLSTIRSGAEAGATAVQPSSLATVATTGNYSDLSGTPEGVYTQTNLLAGTNISITEIPQPVIDENTLGVWHFDGDGNNAVSGSSYGEISSTRVSTDYSKFGTGSYKDDHTDSSNRTIITFSSDNMSSNFTVDMWVRMFSSSANYYYREIQLGDYGAMKLANGKIGYGTFSESETVSATAGEWYHIAFERLNDELRYYVNGNVLGTVVATRTSSATLQIKQASSPSALYIDELRFSNVARYQGNNFTPFNQPYSTSAGDPKYQINNTKASELPSQTGNSGKYLTTDGTSASWATVSTGLSNTATGTDSLTILGRAAASGNNTTNVGSDSSVGSATGATAIGAHAIASQSDATAIGTRAKANASRAVAIGGDNTGSYSPTASASNAIAIGYHSEASAQSAIQLGSGTNSTASTFQVFSTQVVNASGKIPASSMDTSAVAELAMPSDTYTTLQAVASGGSYTAPANGYFAIGFNITDAAGGYIHVVDDAERGYTFVSAVQLSSLYTSLAARKGQEITFTYGNVSFNFIRFVYAEGSKSEAN